MLDCFPKERTAMKLIFACSIALVVLQTGATALSQIKQWTDDQGVTHFGNDPQAERRQNDDQQIILKTKSHEAVESAIQKGIFLKIEKPGEVPLATIGQRFYTLNLDGRRTILDAVWLQYYADLPSITGRTSIIVEVFDERGQHLQTHSVGHLLK